MTICSCQLKNPWGFYKNLVAYVDQIFTYMFKTLGAKKIKNKKNKNLYIYE